MKKISKVRSTWTIYAFAVWALILTVLTGCAGSPGQINRDPELTQAIQNNQVIEGYRYYYYGYANEPWA